MVLYTLGDRFSLDRRAAPKWVAMSIVVGLAGLGGPGCGGHPGDFDTATSEQLGVTRTYFIAADEVVWDYAPLGFNNITGQPFDDAANVFVQNGPDRIGSKYIKALYREYTDASFLHLKPRPAQQQHLGFLGPVIRAAVGDTISVQFKNNTTRPVSIHPHGVFYNKNAEGAPYNDGTSGADTADDAVAPGARFIYRWAVPERAGPGPADGSSVFWMYHSHTDEVADTYAGLMGPLIIGAAGRVNANAVPTDVDRELVVDFMVADENQSPYLQQNIDTFAGDPGSVDPDDDFQESNLMHYQRVRVREPPRPDHDQGPAGALEPDGHGNRGRSSHAALARQHAADRWPPPGCHRAPSGLTQGRRHETRRSRHVALPLPRW